MTSETDGPGRERQRRWRMVLGGPADEAQQWHQPEGVAQHEVELLRAAFGRSCHQRSPRLVVTATCGFASMYVFSAASDCGPPPSA